ncbi:fibronectin type III domain-containing protein [Gaetbulibacter saemankumensis]|uniref:fibronectin type III domain-containing protein n=1 Tax=Gaetbulibacter saemankumensis TaxID=311208 RepID=UPI0004232B2B|nr:GEVED domain-containing protein [Gaetbulibacter saemankumensis]
MKWLIPFACLLLTIQIHSQAEQGLKGIIRSGKTYKAITEEGELYFKRKHPGLTKKQLTEGAYRDGEFVKFERWKNFWSRHLTPDGNLADISAFYQNKTLSKSGSTSKLSATSSSPYAQEPWSNISYSNYMGGQIGTGRTTCIGFHPTDALTFYVGTANGGIWKTTDGGQTYIPLGDDLPLLSVSSILVNANNPNTIYISVSDHVWYGHPGIGVYKSIDGGLTWAPTALTFNMSEKKQLSDIVADPANPDIMLVTTTKGTYKTTDGFNTVSQVNTYKTTSSHKIAFAPGSSNIVYLCVDAGQFYKSTDAGATWTLKKDFGSGQFTLAVTPLDPQRVFLSKAKVLYRSYDQGETFAVNNEKALPENGRIKFSPNNTETLLTGNFEFWRSDNAGSTHTQIADWVGAGGLYEMHVDVRTIVVNPLESNKVYICHDGGIDRLNVDNNNFENLSGGLVITQFYDIATAQSNNIVVSGGSQDNGSVFKNASGTWQYFATTGDGMVTEIDPTDVNTMYWEYQYGDMRRWSGGSNTNISPAGQGGSGAWETPYELDKTNPNRLVVGYKSVYESTNKGNSWTIIGDNISGSNLTEIAISKSNPQKIYAARAGVVYEKDAASNNWTTHTIPTGSITDLKVDPTNENTIYITLAGYSAGNKVYKSIDGGANWTNISGTLPNVPVNAIQTYESVPGGLFIGTFSGVYYTDDSATDWLEYGQLPHTDVRDIEINYTAQKVRVGTHGRGIFEANINVSVCNASSPDTDGDGICDLLDSCPNLDNSLIGTPCDDGDPTTINEVYLDDCGCGNGTYVTPTYCSAQGSAGTGSDYISRVQLNTIDNASEKSTYSDYRNQITDLEIGQTYNVTISLAAYFTGDVAMAWIDFDANGIFDNTTELITFSAYTNKTATAQVTIPQNAQIGVTGFRARNIYGTAVDPCGNYYGEVEDYAVRIIAAPDTEAPTAPTNLAASNITDTTATLTWTASTDNVGVTSYEVFEDGITSIGSVTGTSMNLTGLTVATQYNYTVKAKDEAGNISTASNTVTFTTIDTQAPTAPTNLAASNITDKTATLTWTASTDNVGVTSYEVFEDGITSVGTVTGTSMNLTGLVATTQYSYIVKAKDDAGNVSPASNTLTFTTGTETLPTYCSAQGTAGTGSDYITRVQLNTINNTSGQTQYSDYTNLITDLAVGQTYDVTMVLNQAFASDVAMAWIDFDANGIFDNTTELITFSAFSSNTATAQVTIPQNAQIGLVGFRARNIYGTAVDPCGNYYGEVEDYGVRITAAPVPDTEAPTAPTNLAASNITDTTATLTWTASTDNVGVTSYEVFEDGITSVGSVAGTSMNLTGLTTATQYNYTVKAKDAAGNVSTASNTVTFTTIDTQAPTAPTNLVASNITDTTATLTWTASTDNVGVTSYEVFEDGITSVGSVTGTSMNLTGLTTATQYNYTVKAKDAAGNVSPASNTVTFTTIDTEAPTAPTNLAASNITDTTATLTWTASTDNVGVTTYEVFEDGITSVGSVAGTSMNLTGLMAATQYNYTVKAKDAAGNVSPASNTVTFTTTNQPPATYCTASGTSGTGNHFINRVQINTIDNSSSSSTYSDFTNLSTDLTPGATYTMSIKLEQASGQDNAMAWIDYNDNKSFESNELITFSGYKAKVADATFTVPSGANAGSVRLRVRNIYSSSAVDPCGNYAGEVEDYTVIINALPESPTFGNDSFVYPNPASTELNIKPSSSLSDYNVRILDVYGNTIYNKRNAHEIDVSSFPNGLYIVEIHYLTTSVRLTKKVLVSH